MVSISRPQPITTLDELKQAVATFAVRIGEKLRSQHSLAAVMSVFFNTDHFSNDPQCHRHGAIRLLVPSAAGSELIHWTTAVAQRLFREGYRYKKAGVIVTEIVSDSARQRNLFYQPDTARDDRVSSVMDSINREFGRRTVLFAAEGLQTPWAARADSRSPRYTTRWNELPEVG